MSKRICMIYTGGTIGMVHSEHGYVPSHHSFEETLNSHSSMRNSDMPIITDIKCPPL